MRSVEELAIAIRRKTAILRGCTGKNNLYLLDDLEGIADEVAELDVITDDKAEEIYDRFRKDEDDRTGRVVEAVRQRAYARERLAVVNADAGELYVEASKMVAADLEDVLREVGELKGYGGL